LTVFPISVSKLNSCAVIDAHSTSHIEYLTPTCSASLTLSFDENNQSSVVLIARFNTNVPPVRLSTVGRRAFPVSGATVWNDVPLHVASAPPLAVFRQRLKTFLFSRSYQDTIIWLVCYYHHSSLLSGHPWSLQ